MSADVQRAVSVPRRSLNLLKCADLQRFANPAGNAKRVLIVAMSADGTAGGVPFRRLYAKVWRCRVGTELQADVSTRRVLDAWRMSSDYSGGVRFRRRYAKVWDVQVEELQPLKGHTDTVCCVVDESGWRSRRFRFRGRQRKAGMWLSVSA